MVRVTVTLSRRAVRVTISIKKAASSRKLGGDQNQGRVSR